LLVDTNCRRLSDSKYTQQTTKLLPISVPTKLT
jgi:hypothetical protein